MDNRCLAVYLKYSWVAGTVSLISAHDFPCSGAFSMVSVSVRSMSFEVGLSVAFCVKGKVEGLRLKNLRLRRGL